MLSLAAKFANLAGHTRTISLDVKNISSLTAADAAVIRQSLETDLTRRRFHLAQPSQDEAQVIVTLSENVDDYIWVAQFHADSSDRVEIISVSKTNAASANPPTAALVLEKKLIWQRPAPFLDFAILAAPAASASMLVVLEPDRLAYYTSADSSTWQPSQTIPIPHSTPWPRDPRGSIDPDTGEVDVANVRCTGNLAEPDKMQCAPQAQLEQLKPRIKIPGHEESEMALVSNPCGDQSVVLSTGNDDWTQPDSIQGYLLANPDQDPRASGDPVPMDGPVISLLPEPRQSAARAIVHNLKTGNYEGYVITANCAH